jgi:hypothetical protein
VGAGFRPFPTADERYFQETHPPSFKRGTHDFARFYGMLIDGLQISYVKGFGYNQVLPAPEAEIPSALRALNRSSRRNFGGSNYSSGTTTANRPPLASTVRCRPSILMRCPTRSWSPI